MAKLTDKLLKHLSALSFLLIYFIIAISHLFLEGFIVQIQTDLITTMLPLVALGLILDFLVQHNTSLLLQYKVLVQVLPVGLIIFIFISMLLGKVERETPDYFNYLYWLFLSIPFFIVSYDKATHRKNMINALIGLGFVVFAYLFLTTHTNNLDEDAGIIVYFITYFLMLYFASCLKKARYISIIIGLANGVVLLILRYYPITTTAKIYGWDHDIYNNFEFLMLFSLILCILIRFVAALIDKKTGLIDTKTCL